MDELWSEYYHLSLMYSQCLKQWLATGTSEMFVKPMNESINESMNLGTTSLDNILLKRIPVLLNVNRYSTANGF